jgi:SagB-type dehydrogenase family enzyme
VTVGHAAAAGEPRPGRPAPGPKRYPGAARLALPWPGPGSPPPRGSALDRLSALLLGYGPRRVDTITVAGAHAQTGEPMGPASTRSLAQQLGLRFTVASGGAFYPVEVYLAWAGWDAVPPGLYHYDHVHHCLERLASGSPAALLDEILGPSPAARHAVVLTVRPWKNSGKYGAFGYRLGGMDAGAVLSQMAVARPDGRVRLDADPLAAARLMGLDADLETVYGALELPAAAVAAVPLEPARVAAAGLDHDRLRFGCADSGNLARHRALRSGTAGCRCAGPAGDDPGTGATGDQDTSGRALPSTTPLEPEDLAGAAARRMSATNLAAGLTAAQLAAVLASAADCPQLSGLPLYPRIWCQVSQVDGVPPGVYRYDPGRSRLLHARSSDETCREAALPWRIDRRMTAAGATIYFISPAPTSQLCPHAFWRVHLLTGAALQRAALAAAATGAACRPLGGFDTQAVAARLGLPEGHDPVLQLLLGMPSPRPGSLRTCLTYGYADA